MITTTAGNRIWCNMQYLEPVACPPPDTNTMLHFSFGGAARHVVIWPFWRRWGSHQVATANLFLFFLTGTVLLGGHCWICKACHNNLAQVNARFGNFIMQCHFKVLFPRMSLHHKVVVLVFPKLTSYDAESA